MMESAIQQIARRFAIPHWRWYLMGLITLSLTTWITVSIPRFSKQVVNGILGDEAHSWILTWIFLIIGLGLLQILIRSFSRLFLFWPGRKIESELKNFYFDHLLTLPLPFFQKHPLGDIISRLANDVTQIRACFAFAILQIMNLIFLFSFGVYSMLQVSVSLTLATLAPLCFIIFLARFGAPQVHKYSKIGQQKLGELTNRLTEAFLHVDIIQSNDAVESFVERAASKAEEVYKANIRLAIVRTVIFPLATFLTGLSYLVVLYYGGQKVIEHQLSVGDIIAFNIYVAMLSFPLTALGIIIALVQRAKTSSERLIELETFEKEKTLQTVGTCHPEHSEGSQAENFCLSVKNLNFSYGLEREPALSHLNFDLKTGAKLGITGPIGSGKTSLLNLIHRLYDPDAGSIFYKGKDVLSISPQSLRSEVGLCLQNAYFFSASIRENLSVGLQRTVSEQELIDCTKRAQIYDEILEFDQTWDTLVGERGVRLSGGQKQRLALARLFLRKPELILLDDITAAVDQSTEQRLLHEIESLSASLLIVSHRPTALNMCDDVLLLNKGRLVERAPYDVLLSKYPNLFAEMEKDSAHEKK